MLLMLDIYRCSPSIEALRCRSPRLLYIPHSWPMLDLLDTRCLEICVSTGYDEKYREYVQRSMI